MLTIGDKVEVIHHTNKKHIGKRGKVVLSTTGLKSNTQPVAEDEKLPKLQGVPEYSLEMDDGTELLNLREQQLRKL